MQKVYDPFDIRVKGKSTQDQIASYLVKVVLGLRDKENTQKSVKLLGSGAAIPHTILVAEIIRSRIKGVNSITQFENIEQEKVDKKDQSKKFVFYIPAIRITLTMNPTEEEMLMPGFQVQSQFEDAKHMELFDYVMMYIKNLYFWRKNAQQDNRNNRDNRYDNRQQYDDTRKNKEIKSHQDDKVDRKQDNTRNYQQTRDFQSNSDKSANWNKDRNQFQQTQNQGNLKTRGTQRSNRNDRDVIYEQKNQDNNIQTRAARVGEIRTRGGQQRIQN